MEPVYRTLEIAAKVAVKATGTRITYQGLEHIPSTGGAVVAINHTSYVDFLPAGLAAHRRGRRLRFMIKQEMQEVRSVNYLIKRTGTIPVDRTAGTDAYVAAVEALGPGELVTFSDVRMALEARVPVLPLIVWGAQRLWTKDHPRALGQRRIPITVAVGAPIAPQGGVDEMQSELRESMTALLHRVQEDYPNEPGAFWVPRRLGGSAPTPAEARRIEEAELAERARQRAERAR